MSTILEAPDYRNYLALRIGAQYAKPLARLLVNAAPSDLDADEKKAIKVVERIAAEVQEIFAERDRQSLARIRPERDAFVNQWTATVDALRAKARLPAEVGDTGPRARAVLDSLFGDGAAFVRLDAYAAWFEGQRRLDRIRDEDLGAEIDRLIGAEMLSAARGATTNLGNVIGVGRTPRDAPTSASMAEMLTRFSRAVGAYTRLLAARVDEDDARSIERFRRAVTPIDEYRAMRGRDSDAPLEPAPAVEPPVIGGDPDVDAPPSA